VQPNEFSFNAASKSFEGGGQWQKSLGLVAFLCRATVKSDIQTFTTALCSSLQEGQ